MAYNFWLLISSPSHLLLPSNVIVLPDLGCGNISFVWFCILILKAPARFSFCVFYFSCFDYGVSYIVDSVKLGLASSCGTDLVLAFSRRIFFFLHPNPQASDKHLLISCFCGWCFLALLSQRGYHEWVSSLHKDFRSMGFPDSSW